ncbi:creatininase family protein [Pelagibacterium montanilacus]|uniref:creatininase family protein n=1 Tax=Pelagibacterium montanilacus TaxID=2185280 RepID=UPI000F8F7B87|nr:creatininase family protein [Pelagibacterium montanilacus]
MSLAIFRALSDLDAFRPTAETVAILPVAATEAHGPHLPASTDCDIAEGHIAALAGSLSSAIDAVVLPIARIGASLEHSGFAETQSRDVADLVADWTSIAGRVAGAGCRRLVIVSSHGGNTPVVDAVTLNARARFSMLAVGTAWLRFGQPDGLFDEIERRHGIHGGAIETSLMLHYRPDLVKMDKAGQFPSRLARWETEFDRLSAYGPHRFGWMSTDLNDLGVVGNAGAADAAKGAALAAHILNGFNELLADVARFDLSLFDEKRRAGTP